MATRIKLLSLFAAFSFCVSALPIVWADELCPADKEAWKCFGTIELRISGATQDTVMKMTRYKNDEFMAEVEKDGEKKQYLVVRPSNLELYSGLSGNESIRPVCFGQCEKSAGSARGKGATRSGKIMMPMRFMRIDQSPTPYSRLLNIIN